MGAHAFSLTRVLAQAAPGAAHARPMGTPLPTANWPTWVVVTIFVVLVAIGVIAFKLMRHLRAGAGDGMSDTGDTFDLSDLRRLRDSGQLSVEEYESLRETLRRRQMANEQKRQDDRAKRLR